MFEIKDGYKLELPTLETMELFGTTKKSNRPKKDSIKYSEWWMGQSSFSTMQFSRQLTLTKVWDVINFCNHYILCKTAICRTKQFSIFKDL